MELRRLGTLAWVYVARSMLQGVCVDHLRLVPAGFSITFWLHIQKPFIVAKCVMKGFLSSPRFPTDGLKNLSPRWNTDFLVSMLRDLTQGVSLGHFCLSFLCLASF